MTKFAALFWKMNSSGIGIIYLIFISLCFNQISVTILENNLGASDPVVHVSNLDGYVYHTYTQYASASTISSIDGICFNFVSETLTGSGIDPILLLLVEIGNP